MHLFFITLTTSHTSHTSNYFFLDSRRLNFERANTPKILTIIVTKRSVPAPSVGTNTRTTQPTNNGRIEILQYLRRYEAKRAPKRAGVTLSKAGAKIDSGSVSFPRNGAKAKTPTAIITVVTIAETPIAIVEITSPSSELALTLADFIALTPQGSLRFVMLPVTKLKYVQPAPRIGV